MAKITRVEALMVDLVPKVKRTDAIQSFISQETPIVRIHDADGGIGTGYTYTIGTGGPSIMEPHVSLWAAVPNARWVEYIPQLNSLTAEPMRIADGHAIPSNEPGLGIAWDFKAIEKAAVPGSSFSVS